MNAKKIKLLVLDFDGTIGNSQQLILGTMADTLHSLGLPVPPRKRLAATIGLPLEQCFAVGCNMNDADAEKCAGIYRQLFEINNKPGSVPPFPGVLGALARLHREGVTLTMASSRSHGSLQAFAEEYGVATLMARMVGADDVDHAKPDAEPVMTICQSTGIAPQHTLVVGDSRFDVLMGRNAGAHTCGVTYGNGSREELQQAGADWLADSFAEVESLALGMLSNDLNSEQHS